MELLEEHDLAPYGTFQIGGPADYFVAAETVEDLLDALEWAGERDMPVFVFGGGSNLLFDDTGFRGLVIRVRARGVDVRGHEIHAEAGAMSAAVVKAAAEAGLTGLEAWNGLPGTVGGAVYGNAGCFGVETAYVLKSADVYFFGEGVKTLSAEDLAYGYRDSRLKQEPCVILRAVFELETGNPQTIAAHMKEVAQSRVQKQPHGRTTGSFFKNPPGDHAGRLIDAAGLKGHRVGGMQISEQHANFFLNTGGASAQDVRQLAAHVQAVVKAKFGVELEQEVLIAPVS